MITHLTACDDSGNMNVYTHTYTVVSRYNAGGYNALSDIMPVILSEHTKNLKLSGRAEKLIALVCGLFG